MNEGYISILNNIASKNPTPGGGAVAALTLGHSYSLVSMVARLTISSDKWLEGHDISNNLIEICDNGIIKSMELAKNDCAAFDNVMKSYRLSKNNENERSLRKERIMQSSLEATMAPFRIAEEASNLLLLLPEFAKKANKNALTDLASASKLAHSSVYIASLNVKINAPSISEEERIKYNDRILKIISQSTLLDEETQKIISSRLEW
jgi:formiminotetrahydrofolate cyclodeaminase|tara:strand:+ start:1725 stop:2345 length:621 start_codon:yes stop_codon:yes gene_type:complete